MRARGVGFLALAAAVLASGCCHLCRCCGKKEPRPPDVLRNEGPPPPDVRQHGGQPPAPQPNTGAYGGT